MDAHLMIPATLQLVAWNAPWIVNLVPADYGYENFYSSVCELCWNLDSKHLCSVLVTTSLRIQTVSPRHSLRIATCAHLLVLTVFIGFVVKIYLISGRVASFLYVLHGIANSML